MNIINDKVTEYLDERYKPLNEKFQELRNFAELNYIPIILKDTEAFLLNMVRMKKPKRILEIGTAIGYSASCFAEVSKNCEIITIESNIDSKGMAEANIERLGYVNSIKVYLGDAVEVLKELDVNKKFDFVFIDAGKSHYKDFFDGALKLCAEDAVIISDNVLLQGRTVSDEYDPNGKHKTNIKKMREYIEYITNLENIDTSIVSIGDGLAISVIGGFHE